MSVFIIAVVYMLLLGIIAMLGSRLVSAKKRTNESMETNDAMLGPEDMEKHAVELARIHTAQRSSFFSENLLRRVEGNFKVIYEVHGALSGETETSYSMPPSAEWLLDNFYIIEEQVKEIIQNLPRRYYTRLPVLRNSRMRGFPRIYAICLEMVSHNDGMVDEKSITRFIDAYQSHTTLSLGELWAVPVMLRVALLGNIRAICRNIYDTSIKWRNADDTAEILNNRLQNTQDDILKNIESFFINDELESSAYVERLVQRLRKAGKKSSVIIHWIDSRLFESGTGLEQVAGIQHQMLAAEQVTMGNLITSLKFVSNLDWAELFEALSHVEKILKKDPSAVYNNMDFESRDYYRHIVVKLARERKVSESLVAHRAVECAAESKPGEGIPPVNHVGYYLIGKGRELLEQRLGHTISAAGQFAKKSSMTYAGLIILSTLAITAFFCAYAAFNGGSAGGVLLVLLAAVFPASDIAVMGINYILCATRYPSVLPKLELKNGIPAEISTMVIVPTLLTGENRVKELLDQLEVYYLANRENNLYFALVGDFRDSAAKDITGDEAITAAGLEGIGRLNEIYPYGERDRFYYFHRNRTYNEVEKKWMGWERKRGAIMEFNEFLRGSATTGYTITSCDGSKIPYVKYVVTLDADTILPMGTAKRLIGTIAHPINAAIISREKGIVTHGHGLLQPRIGVSIVSANSSLFARIFAGQGGLDPYVTAVSDVYQDLFGEGIYTGKGIYDVDVFREILKGTIPENSVLSHDLLEGSYLRAGLVTDIELVDGYPSRYASYAARLHRWVRGDWQLLPWLFTYVRNSYGNKIRNPLNFISKWKIIDNLRRSLFFPGLLLLLAAGFTVLPGSSFIWLLFSILAAGFHLVVELSGRVFSGIGTGKLRYGRSKSAASRAKASLGQLFLRFAFIPSQAIMIADAVIRTLVRLVFTRRNLLQWVTAADMEKLLKNDRKSSWRRMWLSVLIAIALLISAYLSKGDWYVSLPVVLIWLCAPELAFRTGQKQESKIPRPGERDLRLLRRVSRKTWKYFEDMVDERDNYLPPDNFQEDPPNGIAHRTSPSNIGLALAAILSARDLGYICVGDMLKRLELTLDTVDRLEKWEGHLYNWYDTLNLSILRPAYVSTVDSGNYAGYLMVIRAALGTLDYECITGLPQALGLRDTIELFNEEAADTGFGIDTQQLDAYLKAGMADPVEWRKSLEDIWSQISSDELKYRRVKKAIWGSALINNLSAFIRELEGLVPLTAVPGAPSDMDVPGLEPAFRECLKSLSVLELQAAYEKLKLILEDFLKRSAEDASVQNEAAGKARIILGKTEAAMEEIGNIRKRKMELVRKITSQIDGMSFKPLYDSKRQLFSIGYNVDEGTLSKSYYDLLASEARQASYIAVARGEVDSRHWFRLGRRMTAVDGRSGLVSWTGTMFEYLMPMLLMKYYENTLLHETYNFALYAQKRYGMQRNIPWGTSESAFFAFDRSLNYQYKAFGVPELGLKRGLANEMVVAPYACIMAVTLDPAGVASNLRRLKKQGAEGIYGFYEALDYTPSRMVRDRQKGIVKNYMVHHLGMSLLALNNYFNKGIMQTRFHSDPVIRCAELFLQEKIPERNVIAQSKTDRFLPAKLKFQEEGRVIRKLGIPDTEIPKMHVLSNGSYSVLLTNGGSGFSRKGEIAVTRWKEDTRDNNGFFIFVQNINSNNAWSATYAPFGHKPELYGVVFAPDRAEFARKDGNIETRTQVVVSTEDNAEIRRLILTNRSQHQRILEVTSYLEVVLSNADADLAHPAFSKLFVTTEFVPEYDCLLASRRPRSKEQKQIWAMHMLVVYGEKIGDIQYETDRLKFIGRNQDLCRPHAMEADQPLSNSTGPVLDPVFSLRRRVRLQPGQTIQLAYMLGTAESREGAMELAEKFRDYKNHERAFELARTRSLIESRYLDLKASEVEMFQEILPSIIFPGSIRRRWLRDTAAVTGGQPALWPFGISGDLPIAVLTVSEREDMEVLQLFLKGGEFWRIKGIAFDLVIIVEDSTGYMQPLLDLVRDVVSSGFSRDINPKNGGIFILNSSQLSGTEMQLLKTAARLWVKASAAPLKDQVANVSQKLEFQPFEASKDSRKVIDEKTCRCFDTGRLTFFNGTGGFEPDGSEYVILVKKGVHTPMPWSNIVTNGAFGFTSTESGPGYTWSENSRENKLTPWSNDPVSDPPGEAIYIRDELDGEYWTVTPAPVREDTDYIVRHGFGYTCYTHESHGFTQELTVFVPQYGNVKLYLTALTNNSGVERKISLTFYSRPVLGVNDKVTSQYLVSGEYAGTGLITVQNVFSTDFAGRVFYVDVSEPQCYITGNRNEFIGTPGSLGNPAAMRTARLSGMTGAGLDPCAAVQTFLSVKPGETREVVFMLGEGKDMDEVLSTSKKYRDVNTIKEELAKTREMWKRRLGTIKASTPDKATDLMLNGWLLYQVTACRLLARSAFYQSGGAFGFRDQLQDVMALVFSGPDLTRAQILLHASHQFVEGDVQHWWHPEAGKGIRTRYSDDLLWLPFVTADYIRCTGDSGVLSEVVPYIEGEPLREDEAEKYDTPRTSEISESLYNHCIKAIDRSLRLGPHGIPLMGSGDWNDGMNTVGIEGKGESIWLGWFIISVLESFEPLCIAMGDAERAERYGKSRVEIAHAIEETAWDGSWYRRAYFDDGTPLGSVQNTECKIDAIAQSWAVISGAGKRSRAIEAMTAVDNYLVDREENIVKLLTPPFQDGDLSPGYIKSYVPGVRENGGQYTHGAVWAVLAYTKLGFGNKALELYHLLNPVNHGRTPLEVARYKVEPYVMAADVYAVHPNVGRGGWTWYTGAAGWMYRVGVEHILGIKKQGQVLAIDPCIPSSWDSYTVDYRFGGTMYHIKVTNPEGVEKGVKNVSLDGSELQEHSISLADDGGEHIVDVVMGRRNLPG